MRINREEIFGPVASVMRVKDYDAALAAANDTPFGLSSGICTTSLKYASHFKRNAEAGMVMVNLPTAGVDYHVPFGGRKGSSFGPREQGRYAAGILHHREDGLHASLILCRALKRGSSLFLRPDCAGDGLQQCGRLPAVGPVIGPPARCQLSRMTNR